MPTAMITGAGTGIGAAFARRFAAEGCDLVLVGRGADRLQREADEHRRRHAVTVEVLAADLTGRAGRESVELRLADPTRTPVDVLVNNAGARSAVGFLATDMESLQSEMDLNITAVWRLTRAALPGMINRGTGVVINVSSVAGFLAPAGSVYGTAKSWMVSFTDTIARAHAGTGVSIIVTCPGYVRTEWHQRFGRAVGPWWSPFWCDADRVVEVCLADLRRGRLVSSPRMVHRVLIGTLELPRRTLRLLARLAPRG